MHTTSKHIELESPGWSDFEALSCVSVFFSHHYFQSATATFLFVSTTISANDALSSQRFIRSLFLRTGSVPKRCRVIFRSSLLWLHKENSETEGNHLESKWRRPQEKVSSKWKSARVWPRVTQCAPRKRQRLPVSFVCLLAVVSVFIRPYVCLYNVLFFLLAHCWALARLFDIHIVWIQEAADNRIDEELWLWFPGSRCLHENWVRIGCGSNPSPWK